MEALANLAHELRSPVQAILGYLDILRDELSETVGGRHKQILDRLNANAHDLAQTVENVMDFSFKDAMAEAEDAEEIRLHDLIGDLAPVLEAANDSKGLEIRFDLEAAPTVFRSRRGRSSRYCSISRSTQSSLPTGVASRSPSGWPHRLNSAQRLNLKSATPDPESMLQWSSRHSRPALSFRTPASAATAEWAWG